ncbi:MAG: chalcone isomerase family protein [Geopsychrobacter sp.]|nr:chalcone isomerase family protein [Geopsychrobacter sp.]
MKKILLMMILICLAQTASALTVKGVPIEPTVKVGDEILHLNGYGLRTKYLMKIYVGSLYTTSPAESAPQVLALPGGKLVRMNFLYSRVKRLSLLGLFAEGFYHNTPQLSGSPEEKAFMSWFKGDFIKGDVVDLAIDKDGTVSVFQNYDLLGSLHSPELAKGILLIYLGDKPASKKLKQGFLSGLNRSKKRKG